LSFFVKPRLENEGGDDEEKISHWWPKNEQRGFYSIFQTKKESFSSEGVIDLKG
jgi:hypothetical protein